MLRSRSCRALTRFALHGTVEARSSTKAVAPKIPLLCRPPAWTQTCRFLRAASRESSSYAPADNAQTRLSDQVRSVMRLLANPVVVCTASHGTAARAMTMSSLTCLSLSPTPLVTFNVATPSRTLDAMSGSGRFNLHILTGDAAGAAVAGHFTRGNKDDGGGGGGGVFDGLTGLTTVAGEDAPLMSGDGVLRVLRCRVLREGPAGGFMKVRDHVVVVGEVLETIGMEQEGGVALAYADRKYRRVGGGIEEN